MQEHRYSYWGLLASLLAMMMIAPVIQPAGTLRLLTEIALASLLIFAVWTVSHRVRSTVVASTLAAAVFGGNLVGEAADVPQWLAIGTPLTGCVFFTYVAAIIFGDVFFSRNVTLNTIIGAVCVYVLIGVFFGFLFGVVDLVDPSSFPAAVGDGTRIGRFIYFSMVTLTTLGYGDITPVSAGARGLAIVEATIGQVFLTVLVARLVGLHLSQSNSGKP